jgi:sigma54-dependent transcription regulator
MAIPMTDQKPSPKDDFLFPRSKYWGEFTPQRLAFNANLQEFAQRVSFVCNLETGGKMSAQEVYDEIKRLWKSLKQSKANLLDTEPQNPPEIPPEEGQS